MSHRVGIWGLGKSGTGAALLAQKHGYEVVLTASQPPAPPQAERLRQAGLDWSITQDPFPLLSTCEVVVRSPGIRPDHPTLLQLQKRGILHLSDLEWGWRHFPPSAQLWMVTGTTGKTSTTQLLTHLLQADGKSAIACGNIGYSFCEAILDHPLAEYYVVEASSFQLWDTWSLVPNLFVVTNLAPNHLDWHGTLEAYADAKLHLLKRLPPTAAFVYDAGSRHLEAALSRYPTSAQVWRFCETPGPGIHAWIEPPFLVCLMKHTEYEEERWEVSYEGTPIEPLPQRKNGLPAILAAARLIRTRQETLRRAFETFEPHPHRLEPVAQIQGVLYLNDSKATTTEAVWYALKSYERPIIWIAGGVDKGNDWGVLLEPVQKHVKALILIGQDTRALERAFQAVVPYMDWAASIDEAVEKAHLLALPGDVVLLSPGCASFDWFESYEQRGEAFRTAVRRLQARLSENPST